LIHVAIAASSPVLLAGLRQILTTSETSVVCESLGLEELASCQDSIDVLVLGCEVEYEVLQQFFDGSPFRKTPTVLLLGFQESAVLVLLKSRKPAFGWLPLDASPEELSAAVRALDEGLGVFHPELMGELYDQSGDEAHPDLDRLDRKMEVDLTSRELQVLQLLAEGLANKQIAVSLGISENTIKFHVSSIYGKLGVNNRLEAVRAGVRRGLIVL
jgi:two-component system, NarL family, response regulator YdfI